MNSNLSGASRYAVASAAGLCVTIGLGLWMAEMIAVNFTAEEKLAAQNYEINPEIIDIDPPEARIKLKPYKMVEVPPPPTPLEHLPTSKPHEVGGQVTYDPPTFPVPKITPTSFEVPISDTNVAPIWQGIPVMPLRAERSGHCKVTFDVSPQGSPFNVRTTYCSDRLFERSSIKAVQKWKFRPKTVAGRPVAMTGVRNQITFRLTDERGQVIPE